MDNIRKVAQGLSDILGFGTVDLIKTGKMEEDERGWSGAEVVRKKIFFADGTSRTMIFKYAELNERAAMKALTERARPFVPAAYSADTVINKPMWMAQEDLGRLMMPDADCSVWLSGVAEALSTIHTAFLENGKEMQWLARADREYWEKVVTGLSVDHFARKMQENPDFNREFGKYLPKLQKTGKDFVRDMTAMSEDEKCMTLTHGDLQMHDGTHIYDRNGTSCVIDFGFCRYAPFYIDLAGWFTADTLHLYYDAFCNRGNAISYKEFETRAKTAFRYAGFIYLCPSVMDWANGPTGQTGKRLLQSLKIILTGNFEERKKDYSDKLFKKILEEHRTDQWL